jgi:hypothetical protein
LSRRYLIRNSSNGESPPDEQRVTPADFRRIGRTACEEKRFAEAIEHLEQAIALDDQEPWSWIWLARARHGAGDPRASADAAWQALLLRPGWVKPIDQLRQLLNDIVVRAPGWPIPASAIPFEWRPTGDQPLDALAKLVLHAGESPDIDRLAVERLGHLDPVDATRIRFEFFRSIRDYRRAWEAIERGDPRLIKLPALRALAKDLWESGQSAQAAAAFTYLARQERLGKQSPHRQS